MVFLPSSPSILLFLFLILESGSHSLFQWVSSATHSSATALVPAPVHLPPAARRGTTNLHSFSVPAKDMDTDLSQEEKRVVAVVRNCSPSVAFVTSVLESPQQATTNTRRQQKKKNNKQTKNDQQQPRGRSLGSGSGFVVDGRGYIVTNYHVIEQTHRLQQAAEQIPSWLKSRPMMTPRIYVRIDGAAYRKCTLVDVEPERDIAVLKVHENDGSGTSTSSSSLPALPWGDSTQLLVGQSLIAIGNPFGLDQTVTTGVVSALGRDVGVTPTNRLRNCIQTDCSINPGNSGGPLLNPQGSVVGVNTAIVSTSGSSAGIGFAIPSADVEVIVRDMIAKHAVVSGHQQQQQQPYWGLSLWKGGDDRVVVATVTPNGPADVAGVRPLTVRNDVLVEGDAIVAVAGTPIATYRDFQEQREKTRAKEQLAVTLEDVVSKDRRVVYITLAEGKTMR